MHDEEENCVFDFENAAKELKEMQTAMQLFELKRKHAETAYNELKDFLDKNINNLPTDLQQCSCNDLELAEQQYQKLVDDHYQIAVIFLSRIL